MIQREISGIVRHFYFGTTTFKIIRQNTGLQYIEEVFTHLSNKKKVGEEIIGGKTIDKNEPVMSQLEHIDFLAEFIFACAKAAAITLKNEVDFNEADAAYWMDVLGYEDAMTLVLELINSYADVGKNHQAPVMGQPA